MDKLECDDLRAEIRAACLSDQRAGVESMLTEIAGAHAAIAGPARVQAIDLVNEMRRCEQSQSKLAALLHEYDLSSREGVLLMCLAEALLRIPDNNTADRFIHDTIVRGGWENHLGGARSLFVNASTWSLILTGRWLGLDDSGFDNAGHSLKHFLVEGGEPLIRLVMKQAVKVIAAHFILAPTIERALEAGRSGDLYSFDMLGEAALTRPDADRYFEAYQTAIDALGRAPRVADKVFGASDISVKLSALHPRFEETQRDRILAELTPRLLGLAKQAREAGIGMTLDAEESDGLELLLDLFASVYGDPGLDGWTGLGLAVQSYQKRAVPVIDWLADLAARIGRRIPVRLVKGAYWDSEIKRAQERGLSAYPVYTRKAATDLCYLTCARSLLARPDCFYPQFATHNSYTVAWILGYSNTNTCADFEFQRLHGMGETLYALLDTGAPCRIYAPIGDHTELLPYLVRRLLENGANSSFVNQLFDDTVPPEDLATDPVCDLKDDESERPQALIPNPPDLYGDARRNSAGMFLYEPRAIDSLVAALEQANTGAWSAAPMPPLSRGERVATREIHCPAELSCVVGVVEEADEQALDQALTGALQAFPAWRSTAPEKRAEILGQAADLLERNRIELMARCVFEGGKTVKDALAEVREAVDYCRYYALEISQALRPLELPGVTGETNQLSYRGRGVFACISPWNFPLAIFVGQVTAALAAGNCVIAKPASQTPLVAAKAVELLHEAGVPESVLYLMPGSGRGIGAALVSDPRVSGVAFTGSTETAADINRMLAARPGPIAPFIAETGGQNVMIVDSSALTEQVVRDVLESAFNSAGQRCSALRVLLLQADIAPSILRTLTGAMQELRVGEPRHMSTDVGPVIDQPALTALQHHVEYLEREGSLIQRTPLSDRLPEGHFFGPVVYEIERLDQLRGEVFGPILHVIRYRSDELEFVLEQVNAMGYGLTLGVHSRVDETLNFVAERARVGNVYVNRNMIGAVVGVQPFGGQGLSGTGPKAGGPDYLKRFSVEQTLTINTTAVGGDAELLSVSGKYAG
jgi:RHH-type proline utilization regulon transcriptional repressor/proline dehydrogenase/delta 1-pyrroline-5-carboxylate dehydrogenase